ncbi:hypothetical protein FACS1894170_13590 [Planctomycetales bacterium]|nr:hypothetical protein FACS1894170_13590 [Planctomycetales bacterium]
MSIDFQGISKCFLTSALPASHEVCITVHNYRRVLTGYALYRSVKPDWQRNADVFYAPCRDLTNVETADALLYALLDSQNNTATTLVNGTLLHNWFNPFDTAKFDFRNCSDAGKHAFDELAKYCNNIVRWSGLATPYGKGIWLGLYQYRTSFEQVNKTYKRKFGRDYPNDDLYGFTYPAPFLAPIESLRKRVESCSAELSWLQKQDTQRSKVSR